VQAQLKGHACTISSSIPSTNISTNVGTNASTTGNANTFTITNANTDGVFQDTNISFIKDIITTISYDTQF